ncbi:hypothetical protein BSN85_20160 [Bradyrhizobium brasilense]|uniref:tyrosine-type recombinase/integrase n=1 Tax=Bradyrhizobium brasilense TaxID=1419277 RepID=UPI0009779AEF|nr:tyrosine-type recombinase/integrase [Bradyrhizobium brasilense]OMI07261.1 hypothetical protein BSN85_20160 [Bradyrhizobium brasilense]
MEVAKCEIRDFVTASRIGQYVRHRRRTICRCVIEYLAARKSPTPAASPIRFAKPAEDTVPKRYSKAWSDFQPEIGLHNLRHTHASQLIDAGVDILTISLGHAKPDITLRVYAHLFRNDDGKAAAINAAFAR